MRTQLTWLSTPVTWDLSLVLKVSAWVLLVTYLCATFSRLCCLVTFSVHRCSCPVVWQALSILGHPSNAPVWLKKWKGMYREEAKIAAGLQMPKLWQSLGHVCSLTWITKRAAELWTCRPQTLWKTDLLFPVFLFSLYYPRLTVGTTAEPG